MREDQYRRCAPRVGVDAICWQDDGRLGTVVDLSPEGLKIERPFVRYHPHEHIQVELEMPEIDELVWLNGQICFDRRRGLVQTVGVRLVSAAARDLRRIRDYVFARSRADIAYDLAAAGCYARG